ncbi:MAG: SDR family NAD(P)-dependent oxidoreductase [Prochloraceae cyanobacterium]|nr:SDR family NAD(P)-dependent oxidoreductase [Prochloraceae cyanobacterium]
MTVTGASQGIGKATAILLSQNNYNVVLAARQPDLLEALGQRKTLETAVEMLW